MARDWEDIRYRGDAADVQELFDTYRVGDYLDTFEENRRRRDLGMRERLLKHGIRLTERLSPRIFRLFEEVCAALEIESRAEVFCLPDREMNAFAMLDVTDEGTESLIGITAGALEGLEDAEIEFVLGHELGHFLYGHNRMNALLSVDEDNPAATVLPPFGESLFLRWRKKAEVSSDRAGLLACRDFRSAARALLKVTFGLSEKNLNLEVDDLVAQIDEISGSPEMIEEAFASHPLLPIRLKALELFSRSERARRNGCLLDGDAVSDAELEKQVDDLIRLTRRYPARPLHEAMMRVLALGGALVLGADSEVNDEEVKVLVQLLHGVFTDEPEKEIVTDREEVDRRLPPAAALVLEEGDPGQKAFLLQNLTRIAMADGALMDAESDQILKLAGMIGIPEREAYAMMVSVVQSGGFSTDIKLNRIAGRFRRSFLRDEGGRPK